MPLVHASHFDCGISIDSDAKNSKLLYFVNGIGNDLASACASSDELTKAVSNTPPTTTNKSSGKQMKYYKSKGYDRDFFYNPGNGIILDPNELRQQAGFSAVALAQAGITDPSDLSKIPDDIKTKYYKELGSMYMAAMNSDDSVVKRITATTMALAVQLKAHALKYQSIVIVPHSQGNFYTEAAYAILLYEGDMATVNKIRVVGVSAIAATTPNNLYITNNEDGAVFGWQKANLILENFAPYKPLPPSDHLSELLPWLLS